MWVFHDSRDAVQRRCFRLLGRAGALDNAVSTLEVPKAAVPFADDLGKVYFLGDFNPQADHRRI